MYFTKMSDPKMEYFLRNFIVEEESENTLEDKLYILKLVYSIKPEIVFESKIGTHINLSEAGIDILRNIFFILCHRHKLPANEILD